MLNLLMFTFVGHILQRYFHHKDYGNTSSIACIGINFGLHNFKFLSQLSLCICNILNFLEACQVVAYVNFLSFNRIMQVVHRQTKFNSSEVIDKHKMMPRNKAQMVIPLCLHTLPKKLIIERLYMLLQYKDDFHMWYQSTMTYCTRVIP